MPKTPRAGEPLRISTKEIPPEERLIFALDVPAAKEAKRLVTTLGESVRFYKVGLELFTAGGAFELIDWLTDQGKKVFADLKLFDVPETVAAAVRQLRRRHIAFTTVHAEGGALRAACREKADLKILAVTVLTSLDQADLEDFGHAVDIQRLVLSRAKKAREIGCDGVVASGLETQALKDALGETMILVTPGIRASENRPADDQKRVVTIEEAIRNGADYVVVGRPIRNAPDPYEAAMQIQGTLQKLFTSK